MSLLKKAGYYSGFILIIMYVVGYTYGGYWHFSSIFFIFIFIPSIDALIGKDAENFPKSKIKTISKEFYYKFITYIWVYAQLTVMVFGAYAVTLGEVNTIIEWAGFILATSLITGGIGITVAHELGHKKSKLEQFYSKVLLMMVCYMHFFIEHNKGHHVHVATPQDPATSRKNESFYKFWVRSVFQGYASAWKLENESRKRKGYAAMGINNQMIWFSILPILFCVLLTAIFSYLMDVFAWQVPVYFFTQSILAFTILEQVNYIEHYGIVRKKDDNDRYELVNQLHSWNANHLVSNFFLFQLQRHSDHHLNAIRRYQVLKHYDESPQLPYGYPTMIILALIPFFWFRFMNPKLEKWEMNLLEN
ncbi:MAG: alkane 1-monooxygenase [Cyclobacteriaceae bacterium]|nr:alkane 1-monooxygenase [Cyclobacteriaceae bacterium]